MAICGRTRMQGPDPPSKQHQTVHCHIHSPVQAGNKPSVSACLHNKKTEAMMLNVRNPSPVKVNGEDVPTTSKIHPTLLALSCMGGGAGNNLKYRLNKVWTRYGSHPSTAPGPSKDQGKTVPELHTFHRTLRLRMLEDYSK